MQLSKFKIHFKEALDGEYPETEIESFFRILMENILGLSRLEFAMNPGYTITADDREVFENAIRRLKKHEPVQYITGETSFLGKKFLVNKHVLIPRPETEELVQWITEDHKNGTDLRILDIGTGSGCIAIGLALALKEAEVIAMDVSEEALDIARKNASINNAKVTFRKTDVLQIEKLDLSLDVIVSNPPYVREREKKDMQRNVLEHEPKLALYVEDTDPLLFYRTITLLAKSALKKDGSLYFEINQYLAEETERLVRQSGFETELKKDIFGNYRMLKGIRK